MLQKQYEWRPVHKTFGLSSGRDGTEECSESKAGRTSLSVRLSRRRRKWEHMRGVLCGRTMIASQRGRAGCTCSLEALF